VDENRLKPGEKTDWRVEPDVVAREAKLSHSPLPRPWTWKAESMPMRMTVPTDAGSLELVPYGSANLRVSMFGVKGD